MELLTEKQINYFKSKIAPPDANGCCIWCGSLDKDGYGRVSFRINDKKPCIRAHRLAKWIVEKPIDNKLLACHKPIICHNRLCCNPDHIYWGTVKQNTNDQVLDGTFRDKKGIKHHNAKLTEEQVKEIKLLLKEGKLTQRKIAKSFELSQQHICDINTGKRWSHITID